MSKYKVLSTSGRNGKMRVVERIILKLQMGMSGLEPSLSSQEWRAVCRNAGGQKALLLSPSGMADGQSAPCPSPRKLKDVRMMI